MLALVDDLAFGLDGTTVLTYYDDLMWDAARWGVATTIELLESVRGDGQYALPATEARVYAIFYDDVMLSQHALQDLEAVNPLWRDLVGKPAGWVSQDESEHDIQLVPTPDQSSVDFSFIHGAPEGVDFPDRAISVVMGVKRDDLPAWLDVPLALAVLSREFERESDHRDTVFAQACRTLGDQLLALVLA